MLFISGEQQDNKISGRNFFLLSKVSFDMRSVSGGSIAVSDDIETNKHVSFTVTISTIMPLLTPSSIGA